MLLIEKRAVAKQDRWERKKDMGKNEETQAAESAVESDFQDKARERIFTQPESEMPEHSEFLFSNGYLSIDNVYWS